MTINLCIRQLACSFACTFSLLLYSSCNKSTLGPCTGNCQVVNFTGIAVDPGGQKPLANLEVTVYMSKIHNCTYCGPDKVITGTTKADGTFALTTSVDTTLVFYRECALTVQGPVNYIPYPVPTGPGIEADPNPETRQAPIILDSTGIAPYTEFDFFQRVPLTVQLHRTAPIVGTGPYLSLTFMMGRDGESVWGLNENSTNADTALTLYTGANVFTLVNSITALNDSTKVNQTDSIRCVAGANNTLIINYP